MILMAPLCLSVVGSTTSVRHGESTNSLRVNACLMDYETCTKRSTSSSSSGESYFPVRQLSTQSAAAAAAAPGNTPNAAGDTVCTQKDPQSCLGDSRYYLAKTGSSNPFAAITAWKYSLEEQFNSTMPEGGFNSAPALYDVMGDGLADLVIGNDAGTLEYYENTGTSTSPAFTQRTGSRNPFAGITAAAAAREIGFSVPALYDVTGDGLADLIIGNYLGTLEYYENTGTSSNPTFTKRTGSSNPFAGITANSFALHDITGDGLADLIIGNYLGTLLSYYENTGTSSNPTFTKKTGSSNPFAGITAADFSASTLYDITGDGLADLVIGRSDGILSYYENTGTSTSPIFAQRTGSSNPFANFTAASQPSALAKFFGGIYGFSKPALYDITGDGQPDLLVIVPDWTCTSNGTCTYYGALQYYENSITSTSPAFTPVTGSSNPFAGITPAVAGATYGYSAPALYDITGDGLADLIMGNGVGSLEYFVNAGTAPNPTFTHMTGSSNPFAGIAAAGGFGVFNRSGTSAPALYDVTGDGLADLVIGNDAGTLQYYENTGTSTSPAFTQRTGSRNPFLIKVTGGNSAPALYDVTGDGLADLVIGGSLGYLGYYENTGTSTSPAFTPRTGSRNPFPCSYAGGSGTTTKGESSQPALYDVTGDGLADLVIGNGAGTLQYYENTGTSTSPAFTQRTGSRNPFAGITAKGLHSSGVGNSVPALAGGLYAGLGLPSSWFMPSNPVALVMGSAVGTLQVYVHHNQSGVCNLGCGGPRSTRGTCDYEGLDAACSCGAQFQIKNDSLNGKCNQCAATFYPSDASRSSSNPAGCTKCIAGFECPDGDAKLLCPEGSYCPPGIASGISCGNPKYYCPAGSTNDTGSTCPAGFSCTTSRPSLCNAPNISGLYYSDAGRCLLCGLKPHTTEAKCAQCSGFAVANITGFSCVDGHRGACCKACDTGYAITASGCSQCGNSSISALFVFLALCALALFSFVYVNQSLQCESVVTYIRSSCCTCCTCCAPDTADKHDEKQSSSVAVSLVSLDYMLLTILSDFTTYASVLSSVKLDWSDAVQNVFLAGATVSATKSQNAAYLSCSLAGAGPCGLVWAKLSLFFLMSPVFVVLMVWLRLRFTKRDTLLGAASHRWYRNAVFVPLLLLHTSACELVFPMLGSIAVDGNLFMRSDPSVKFGTAEYSKCEAGAVLLLLFYIIAVPLFIIYKLYNARPDSVTGELSAEAKLVQENYGFVTAYYRPEVKYWKLVLLMLKMAMVALSSVLETPTQQIYANMALFVVATSVQIYVQPCVLPRHNTLQTLVLFSIFAMTWLSLAINLGLGSSYTLQILIGIIDIGVAVVILANGAPVMSYRAITSALAWLVLPIGRCMFMCQSTSIDRRSFDRLSDVGDGYIEMNDVPLPTHSGDAGRKSRVCVNDAAQIDHAGLRRQSAFRKKIASSASDSEETPTT